MSNMNANPRARGFSLIEVMVAVIVICVGLLGVAKMQALSLSNANTSRQRSLAALEAASLAASMHSNREYWANVIGPFNIVLAPPPAAPAITSSDAVLAPLANADLALGLSDAACIGGAGGLDVCSNVTAPAKLAAFDLGMWASSLAALLPNPSATILCTNGVALNVPTSCTIQIGWTETPVAMTQQQALAAAGAQTNLTYLLYVEP